MCYCIPYHTENKSLVPEWPCIIEVSYIYSSYTPIKCKNWPRRLFRQNPFRETVPVKALSNENYGGG
jgi:hypothetical protein